MMKNWIVKFNVILLFLVLTLACSERKTIVNENTITFEKFLKTDTISFENIVEFKKGWISNMIAIDTSIFMLNGKKLADFSVYECNTRTKNISKGQLRKGRGPNETIGDFGISINANKKLAVLDITKKKIFIAPVDSLQQDKEFKFSEMDFESNYYQMCIDDDLNMLGVGDVNSKHKISRISTDTIENFGTFFKFDKDVPFSAFKDAYLSYIYKHPTKNKVVLPYRYTDLIEIFDLDMNKSIAISGPEQFDVEWQVMTFDSGSVMRKTPNTRKAFLSASVTNQYIYALFSGHSRVEEHWSDGKYIYVYDWNGTPIKKIVLDRYVSTLAISSDNKTLYSFDENIGYIVKTGISMQ
jgi:hypothetical protein